MGKSKGLFRVLTTILGFVVGYIWGNWNKENKKDKEDKDERLLAYYDITTKWIQEKQEGKELVNYFKEKGYQTIGVYGQGILGMLFYNEIKGKSIQIKYFVDGVLKEETEGIDGLPVLPIKSVGKQEKVDAIVITPTFDMKNITKKLQEAGYQGELIGLNDVVHSF